MTIAGVWLISRNSPENFSVIDGGDSSTDFDAIDRIKARKNRLMKVGTYLVVSAAVLQFISLFI